MHTSIAATVTSLSKDICSVKEGFEFPNIRLQKKVLEGSLEAWIHPYVIFTSVLIHADFGFDDGQKHKQVEHKTLLHL